MALGETSIGFQDRCHWPARDSACAMSSGDIDGRRVWIKPAAIARRANPVWAVARVMTNAC